MIYFESKDLTLHCRSKVPGALQMSSSARLSPRDSVFTTLVWNGGSKIADMKKHMNRLHEHAQKA